METHFHWLVWAYRSIDAQGRCEDNVTVDVLAATEAEALAAAEKLLPGRLYRVQSVIQHFGRVCKP